MKLYTKEEICAKFTKYVRVNFYSATEAADYYGVTRAFISNIKREHATPNKQMLKDIGFKRERGFVKL